MYVPTRKVIRNAIRNTYKASGADRIAPRIIKAAPMTAIDPSSDAKHETAMIDLFDIDFPFCVSRETFLCSIFRRDSPIDDVFTFDDDFDIVIFQRSH